MIPDLPEYRIAVPYGPSNEGAGLRRSYLWRFRCSRSVQGIVLQPARRTARMMCHVHVVQMFISCRIGLWFGMPSKLMKWLQYN